MNAQIDLINDIQQTLTNSEAVPWFPSLTGKLVSWAEYELLRPKGLSLNTFGVERFLKRDPIADHFAVIELSAGNAKRIAIEQLGSNAQKFYEKLGLRVRPVEDLCAHDSRTIYRALNLLRGVPSLSSTVTEFVRSAIILDAGDPQLDVSHSDPTVPFVIFFSIPPSNSDHAAIRVMESIVHEAMHLQLTVIESCVDLVSQSDRLIHSPWRTDRRPPQGVLHGAYVFSVIACAFELMLRACDLSSYEKAFLARRLDNISIELKIALASLAPDLLTTHGRALVALLRQNTNCVSGI